MRWPKCPSIARWRPTTTNRSCATCGRSLGKCLLQGLDISVLCMVLHRPCPVPSLLLTLCVNGPQERGIWAVDSRDSGALHSSDLINSTVAQAYGWTPHDEMLRRASSALTR